MDGLILVDKPQGLTSHDVVARIRKILGLARVGHFGTLDPLATGLLIIGVGTATRLFPVLSRQDKIYRGRIRLGLTTDTYDALGRQVGVENASLPSQKDLLVEMEKFVGKIKQVPPPYSAKKKEGKPLYQWARAKKPVELNPHLVTVYSLKLTDYTPPDVSFEVKCSSGTYVRSLAHNLGQSLGCGAHLAALCRTEAGKFRASSAFSLEQLEKLTARGNVQEFLMPLETLFQEWPKAVLSSKGRGMVQKGKAIPSEHILRIIEPEPEKIASFKSETIFRVFSLEGKFLALARRDKQKQDFVPYLILR